MKKMSRPTTRSNDSKIRSQLMRCKHNSGRTQKAFGCGGNFEKAFKCELHELCVLRKPCKSSVVFCEKCNDFEVN